MFIKNHICLWAFLIVFQIQAQRESSFVLNGKCNIDSGLVHLGFEDNSYYKIDKNGISSKIRNGKFTLRGKGEFPSLYRLFIKQNNKLIYYSEAFFICKGENTLLVDKNSMTPKIENTYMYELSNGFSDHFKLSDKRTERYWSKMDSLKRVFNDSIPDEVANQLLIEFNDISNQKDTLLLSYAKKNPKSDITLWKLIQYFAAGYKPIYDSVYHYLSPPIRKTYAGRVMYSKLTSSRISAIGNIFPVLTLSDSNQKVMLDVSKSTADYTLIDFWFSHCSPCISQFYYLKKIFHTYHSKGFNVIGISVDNKDNIDSWKNIIQSYDLDWNQYLDLEQTESKRLSVNIFPTNFLLNKEGRIIAKNLSPFDLDSFLKHAFDNEPK